MMRLVATISSTKASREAGSNDVDLEWQLAGGVTVPVPTQPSRISAAAAAAFLSNRRPAPTRAFGREHRIATHLGSTGEAETQRAEWEIMRPLRVDPAQ